MRKYAVIAGAIASVLAVVAVAHAAVTQTAKMTVTKATASKPVSVNVTTTTTESTPGKAPPATRLAVLTFGQGLDLLKHKSKFPVCNARIATAIAACPAGSKVGSGQAKGVALNIPASLKVTAANGPGKTLLLGVRATKPIDINVIIRATLRKVGSKTVMNVPIPPTLVKPIPGNNTEASLTLFQTKVQKSITKAGKKYDYLTLTCPKSRKITISGKFNYTNGTSKTANGSARC